MYRWLRLVVVVWFVTSLVAAEPKEGVRPVGADGKPLNLDFETGTLKDWTAEGDAFEGQPIKGDTVAQRRGDMKSQHQGNYWIGSYETRRRQAAGHAHLRAVQGDASVGVVPRRRRAVAGNLRRAGPQRYRTRSSPHLGHRGGKPAPRRRRSAAAPGQGDLHPPRRQAHRPLGAHQLRRLPLPRREAERAAARKAPPPPDVVQVRRPDAGEGRHGDDRAGGLQGHAVRRRAGRACSRSPCASTIAAGSGSPRRTAIPFGDPTRRRRTASSSSRTPTATASSTSAPSSWKG